MFLSCMLLIWITCLSRMTCSSERAPQISLMNLLTSHEVAAPDSTFPRYRELSRHIPLHHDTSRITPSNDLPLDTLLATSGREPYNGERNPKRLLRILGGRNYNSDFMSDKRPEESFRSPNGTLEYDLSNGHPRGKMPPELKSFTLNVDRGRNQPRLRLEDKHDRHVVRRFLWNYSYCPVLYRWKDLGARFWPRWIREGSCYNGRSCSIPAGMRCQQSASTSLTLLYWHCRRMKKCLWIRIQYPVISACNCGC